MRTHFNNKMIFPPNIKDIFADNRRQLGKNEQPLISIESEAGEDSNIDYLNLDWDITRADESSMDFKLKYKEPLEVS